MSSLLASASAWKQAHGLTNGRIATVAITIVLSSYALYIHLANKCDMVSILLPLLATSARHFSTVNASYWLDYGTLLGAYRDGGVVPWEFDIDMAVAEEDCEKFLVLKDAMAKDGLTMYKRGEYVPHKKSMLMGYDAYLHKACARIYDKDFKYYIDFDWYQRYTYEEATKFHASQVAKGEHFILPKGYKESDGDVLCNIEAIDASWPGGCRVASWVYPLQPWTVLGVQQWIPAQPEANLLAMYGSDWRIPRPKGYKYLVCGWMPIDNLKFFLLWLAITALPGALYLAVPWLWNRLLVMVGRRNVTHKYTTLPLHHVR
jgi:hypothetical protein